MVEQKRKLKNMLVMPKLQLKLFGYFAISGLLFFVGIIVLASRKLLVVQELMNANTEMAFDVQMQVNELMNEVVLFTLAGFVLYIFLTSILALVLSHRIAGPVVAITAYIEELKGSNFDYQRSLRPKDELHELMDGLKELMAILKEKENNKE